MPSAERVGHLIEKPTGVEMVANTRPSDDDVACGPGMIKRLFVTILGLFLAQLATLDDAHLAVTELKQRPKAKVIWLIGGLGHLGQTEINPSYRQLLPTLAEDEIPLVVSIDASSKIAEADLATRRQTAGEQKALGFLVVDKDSQVGQKILAMIKPDIVFVQTPPDAHVSAIEEVLSIHPQGIQAILVEKPFADNLEAIDQARHLRQKFNVPIYGFDMVLSALMPSKDDRILKMHKIIGRIQRLSFYWVQNRGADDHATPGLHPGPDPVARERREKALNAGLTVDGLPHFGPLAQFFVDVSSPKAQLISVHASRFPCNLPEESETASASIWSMPANISGSQVLVDWYSAKGISEIGSLDKITPFNGMIVKGDEGSIEINIDRRKVYAMQNETMPKALLDLESPYESLLLSLIKGSYLSDRLTMSVEFCARQLAMILEVKAKIVAAYAAKGSLAPYALGTKTSPSPTLEAVFSGERALVWRSAVVSEAH